MRSTLIVAVPMAVVLVTACAGNGGMGGGGGGGGGGSSPGKTPMPFTSFSAVQFDQPVQATAMSQTVSATKTAVLGGVNITSTTVNLVDTASSSAQLTYGILPAITAFSFSTPQSNVSFSGINVQCVAGTGVCSGSNTPTVASVTNALDATVAWNYQSFGYWLAFPSTTTALAGAISFGNATPVASIPVSGTATYHGLSSGSYVDQTGAVFVHAAQMQSLVDFGPARSVAFSTVNTTVSPLNATSPTPFPALNLSGNLTITTGANQFIGTVNAPGGGTTPAMTGTATGRFYGPTTQEIGGIFSLKGTGPQTMLGGFGGKQP
jgi:C-lobe and N-lobe beta barrels of Tf-binding protein B